MSERKERATARTCARARERKRESESVRECERGSEKAREEDIGVYWYLFSNHRTGADLL